MELTIEQINDYRECPLMYKLKHVNQIEFDDKSKKQEFKDKMRKVVQYYYYNLMDGNVPTESQLRAKWDSLWYDQNKSKAEMIFEERTAVNKLGLKGYSIIKTFYRNVSANPGAPIIVDWDFEVPVGKHLVSGNIELVRELKEGYDRNIEIVGFRFGGNVPKKFIARVDLNLTLQAHGLRKLLQGKEQRLIYWYPENDKKIYTMRDRDSFKRLESTVENIAKGIEHEIYYPRERRYRCRSCSYKDLCEVWTGE